jgi:hypothetical protein
MCAQKWIKLTLTGVVIALLFACLADEYLSKYVQSTNGNRHYLVGSQNVPMLHAGDTLVFRQAIVRDLLRHGYLSFAVNKYRDAEGKADGITINVYADNVKLIAQMENPYASDLTQYAEDNGYRSVDIEFDIPQNTKELVVEIVANGNPEYDDVRILSSYVSRLSQLLIVFSGLAVASLLLIWQLPQKIVSLLHNHIYIYIYIYCWR